MAYSLEVTATASPKPTSWLLSTLRTNASPYVILLFALPVVAQFVHYVEPNGLLIKGQAPGITVSFLLFIAAFICWLMFQPTQERSRSFLIFACVIGMLWVVLILESRIDGSLFNLTAFIYLPALFMLWWKPPTFSSVISALDVVAWSLIAISVLSQLLDYVGARSMNHEFPLRWSILTDIIGVTTRWEGPFGNVNYAGPIGAFLVVYGVCRFGWNRMLLVFAGCFILLASEARTSWIATLAGLAIIFLSTPKIWRIVLPLWVRIVTVLIGLFGAILILVGPDSDLNARTPLWQTYFDLWKKTPLSGIGETGINQNMTMGVIPGWASHAHSMYLDTLFRYGLLAFGLVIASLAIGAVIGIKAAQSKSAIGLALLVTFIFGALTETIIDWRYLSIQGLIVVNSVLLAASWLSSTSTSEQPKTQPTADLMAN